MNFPIDFVVTWVDGSDPSWIAKKNQYSTQAGSYKKSMSSQKAYRDWGTFKYWFRGVEKFAPWVNHIYLVTDNQVPTWLSTKSTKLTVVDHRDFIPGEYLPTFNSNAIEANIHRIKGLSEHFVIFNDDMYLTSAVKPSDFFSNDGLPKYNTAINPIVPERYGTGNFQINDMEIVNSYFSKKEIVKNAKLFSYKQGIKNVIRTMLYVHSKFFFGFYEDHLPYSMLKSTIEKIWNLEGQTMITTSKSKFRSKTDTNLWLFKYWQIASGKYSIRNSTMGKLFSLDNADDNLWNLITSEKYKIMCINDGFDIKDADYIEKKLKESFEKLLSQRSNFETSMVEEEIYGTFNR